MVHSQTIKELTEDELLLLWGVMSHIYGLMGMECKYKWLQMVKVNVLEHILNNCNIKEEYHNVRDSLMEKLRGGVY